ncbi:MAG TPA: glycosyltransferase [Anaerolineaceae bacterium]|nr:glycosyltransferase [Anaerolineaceae bacterium]
MVAYISRLQLPDPAANSLQTVRMAAALAELRESTALFVHDLAAPEADIRRAYGIERSNLRFWPLGARRWPGPVYNQAMLRFLTYNAGVAGIVSLHPAWRRLDAADRVLFVRSRLEILYWGLLRPYLPWLRDWLLACELHDLPGGGEEPDETPARAARMARALKNYDLVITVNQALAEDLTRLTEGAVCGQVLPLCSGLERLAAPPAAPPLDGRVVIGYFGTIDRGHGIETAIRALEYLPERFVLRLTGRVRPDAKDWVAAGAKTGRVEVRGPVPYAQMAAEIDGCHLALVPAGASVHATRYRSPLKIFDAMLRGKPILAADVPCHRELLQADETAQLFRSGDPADLAAAVQALAADPPQMQRLARAAWEASAAYTYPARARALLARMDAARCQKRKGKSAHG